MIRVLKGRWVLLKERGPRVRWREAPKVAAWGTVRQLGLCVLLVLASCAPRRPSLDDVARNMPATETLVLLRVKVTDTPLFGGSLSIALADYSMRRVIRTYELNGDDLIYVPLRPGNYGFTKWKSASSSSTQVFSSYPPQAYSAYLEKSEQVGAEFQVSVSERLSYLGTLVISQGSAGIPRVVDETAEVRAWAERLAPSVNWSGLATNLMRIQQ